jgi:hypothetical protein
VNVTSAVVFLDLVQGVREPGLSRSRCTDRKITDDVDHQRGRVGYAGTHSQARAAEILGVTQPRVSDLVRGRIDLFSIDALVDFLAQLGVGVTVRTTRPKRLA